MSYCREHSTMNCVVCALREQTRVLVLVLVLELRAIARLLEPEIHEDRPSLPVIPLSPGEPACEGVGIWYRCACGYYMPYSKGKCAKCGRTMENQRVEAVVPLQTTPVRASYEGTMETVTTPRRCPARREPTLWERLMHRTSEQELRCSRYEEHQAMGYPYHEGADGTRWVD